MSNLWPYADRPDWSCESGGNYGSGYPLDIKVAVMGCVVNGPGEAKEADIGIAGGVGVGLLIKHGEIVEKVPEDQLLERLRQELLNWTD